MIASEVQALLNVNFGALLMEIVIVLVGLKFLVTLFTWVCNYFGIEFKSQRELKERKELLDKVSNGLIELQNRENDDKNKLTEAIDSLNDKFDGISVALETMRTDRNADKLAEYKDRIGQAYRVYSVRKDENGKPYWNSMEKEAMEDLIVQYEAHGGTNSFVHKVVQKEMYGWTLI